MDANVQIFLANSTHNKWGTSSVFFFFKTIVAWGENNKKGEVFIKRLELKTFIRGKKLKGEWKQLCVMAVVLD